MTYLMALLAFAAVMTLASTLVAVILEGINRALGLHAKRLRELVRQFHEEAVRPRIADAPEAEGVEHAEDADGFAVTLLRDPTHTAEQLSDLTIRQLMEQLAGTRAGAALRGLPRERLQPRLEALAYEFDRLGAASRARLRRRARTWSVVIAFIMAFSLNVDAFRLFGGLAQDRALTQLLVDTVNVDALAARYAATSAALAEDPTDRRLRAEEARLADSLADARAATVVASGLQLPIGATQYPYCLPFSPLFGALAAADGGDAAAVGQAASVTSDDPRCARHGLPRKSAPPPPACFADASCASGEIFGYLGTRVGSWADNLDTSMLYRTNTDTFLWLVGVLAAGGMIGLGAPFWFNVYRSVAALVPAARAASNAVQGIYSGAGPTPRDAGRRADAHVMDGEGLYQAFATTAGESPVLEAPAPVAAPGTPAFGGGASPAAPGHGAGRRRLV